MSIWKRLKNLWLLSEFDVTPKKSIDSIISFLSKDKDATIVDMKDPLDIDLGEDTSNPII